MKTMFISCKLLSKIHMGGVNFIEMSMLSRNKFLRESRGIHQQRVEASLLPKATCLKLFTF